MIKWDRMGPPLSLKESTSAALQKLPGRVNLTSPLPRLDQLAKWERAVRIPHSSLSPLHLPLPPDMFDFFLWVCCGLSVNFGVK